MISGASSAGLASSPTSPLVGGGVDPAYTHGRAELSRYGLQPHLAAADAVAVLTPELSTPIPPALGLLAIAIAYLGLVHLQRLVHVELSASASGGLGR